MFLCYVISELAFNSTQTLLEAKWPPGVRARLQTHRHFPLRRNFQTYSSAPRDTVSFSDLLPVSASVQLKQQKKKKS